MSAIMKQVAYLSKLISSWAHDRWNGKQNDCICHCSFCLDVKDCKTKNKMHVVIIPQIQRRENSSLNFKCTINQVWQQSRLVLAVHIACYDAQIIYSLFVSSKWKLHTVFCSVKHCSHILELLIYGIFHFWSKFWVLHLMCRNTL